MLLIEELDDAVEILIAVEVDGHRALASAGTLDFDLGLYRLANLRQGSAVGEGSSGLETLWGAAACFSALTSCSV